MARITSLSRCVLVLLTEFVITKFYHEAFQAPNCSRCMILNRRKLSFMKALAPVESCASFLHALKRTPAVLLAGVSYFQL
jgi:hypothetical protein